jgi:hypothetical protein
MVAPVSWDRHNAINIFRFCSHFQQTLYLGASWPHSVIRRAICHIERFSSNLSRDDRLLAPLVAGANARRFIRFTRSIKSSRCCS